MATEQSPPSGEVADLAEAERLRCLGAVFIGIIKSTDEPLTEHDYGRTVLDALTFCSPLTRDELLEALRAHTFLQ